jgi:signal transduction histidine kinase
LALVVAVVVAPVLLGLVVAGLLMVISGHDVTLLAAIVLGAAAFAVIAAKLIADGILRDVEAIRDGLEGVGRGQRDVHIDTSAPDELSELAVAANAMIGRLRAEEIARDQSEAARRDLVAAVSHDLRTPITSLRLLADAVGDDIVDGEVRRGYLERMSTHIEALSALIDDLFELSRLEAGDIRWSLEQVPLSELVGETVAAMRVQAQAKGVAVMAEVPDALCPARANPEKLQRVLFNLIQNAIRHTPADGSVVVRAEPVADRIEVEVADTGDGIAPDQRDHVFTAFYRGGADTARTGAGAGLGLAVSRAIVEAHGGRIWLADTAVGTRVRFSLPVAA